MGKCIKLGTDEPTLLSNITISKYDECGDEQVVFSDQDNVNGLMIQTDMTELAEAVANLGNQTDGKITATNFLKAMVKDPDILGDEIFNMCGVLLDTCVKQVSSSDQVYYNILKAARAAVKDLENECW